MAKDINNGPTLPSLLDRLIDRDPRVKAEAPATQIQSLRQLKESLRRDLEFLLNTRRTPEEAPISAPDLRRSVYNFGLPDFSNYSFKTGDDRRRMAQLLETAISSFEPRLGGVTVVVQEFSPLVRVLSFHIEGFLRIDPAPERVFFDAKLELANSQYRIEGESGAR
jgi:type VI secretion system protein ImpF